MENIEEKDWCRCLHPDGEVRKYPPKSGSGVANPKYPNDKEENATKGDQSGTNKNVIVFVLLGVLFVYWIFAG